ncbi:MAG TPA: ABC transporter permease, partial [Gemmatimonadaceae bacterium]|nr:ABC transporter permease [Gemmatimonadaceae bacterium]
MTTILHDLRYALRSLRRSPGFTLVAILTLALGIGATTAIYSAVNDLLLRPLPFKGGDRLVYVMRQNPNAAFTIAPGARVIDAWRQGAHSLEALEPYAYDRFSLQSGENRTQLTGFEVPSDFLSFLGLSPALGRMFAPDEVKAGGPPVVLLSYALWQRDFGGERSVLGRTIRLNDTLYTVIGVMPSSLQHFEQADVWAPLRMRSGDGRMPAVYSVIARLRPRVTIEQAQQELDAIAERVPGDMFAGWKARVMAPQLFVGGNLREVLPILLGAVGFVLLIACANVALLLLARGAARERELAIRLSLGAARRLLVRSLFMESVLLAVAGGALGLLLAWWGVDALTALRPERLSDLAKVGIDMRVLAFAIAISLGAALLFGVVPAFRATDVQLGDALRSGAPGSGGAARGGRMRNVLVAGEMMLSVVLLVGAGVLVHSLIALQHADLGFQPDGLVTVQTMLPTARYPNAASRTAFTNELVERARSLPGAIGAAISTTAPPDYGMSGFGNVEIEGRGPVSAAPHAVATDRVRADYFHVLGIPMLQGRSFTDAEVETNAPVIILSRGLATRLFPDRPAVGQRIRFGPQGSWETVVGIVGDVAAMGAKGSTRHLQAYDPLGGGLVPLGGNGAIPGMLIVRSTGDIAALAPTLRGLVHSIDPSLPAPNIATVRSHFAAELAAPRFNTILLGIFAALALALAAVGLFGVLSYAVARRTREIGIRVALGAQSGDVRALVVRQGMLPALVGLGLGIVAALFATRVLASLLYGVAPRDTAAFVAAGLVLLATALVACYLPARRA